MKTSDVVTKIHLNLVFEMNKDVWSFRITFNGNINVNLLKSINQVNILFRTTHRMSRDRTPNIIINHVDGDKKYYG